MNESGRQLIKGINQIRKAKEYTMDRLFHENYYCRPEYSNKFTLKQYEIDALPSNQVKRLLDKDELTKEELKELKYKMISGVITMDLANKIKSRLIKEGVISNA